MHIINPFTVYCSHNAATGYKNNKCQITIKKLPKYYKDRITAYDILIHKNISIKYTNQLTEIHNRIS